MEQTYFVTVGQDRYSYPAGTTFQRIAEDFQGQYPSDILLVDRNGKLCELWKPLDRDCTLKLLTIQDRPGMQAYERSAIFLMLKAFYDVLGRDRIQRISVEYSLSHALFVLASGSFRLDQALLDRVEARMRELSAQAIPIRKHSVPTDDAIALFQAQKLPDKAKLLAFRVNSRVNYYQLEDFTDYFYGYMVPDTGYLRQFKLELFDCGLILRLPDPADPAQLLPFQPSLKVFRSLYDSDQRSKAIHISNVADLNEAICHGTSTQMILASEAMMEKRIGDIAETVANRPDVRFVMIAGPSSSGKTTFSHRLSTQLIACGLHPHPIATDNYFKNRADTPLDEDGQPDFESLNAMDVEQFNQDMSRLLRGETVELPHYNFKKGVREYNGNTLTLGPRDVLVIEGIHCLNDAFSYALPREEARQFAVYPALVEVRPDLFLRNLWNADTGTRGVMEDVTVIRSTRDYQTSDSLRRINWRLTARGLPLSVNVYEDILPKSVHFIFDGESFSGAHPRPEELEDALSILASELVRLEGAQVRCGLSLSAGRGGEAVNLFALSSTTEDLLCALAAYEPAEPVRDTDGGQIVDQLPDFDAAPLVRSARGVGRFYYIAYSTACLPGRALLTRYLDHTCASILTYRNDKPFGEYETVCLRSLKEDGHGG